MSQILVLAVILLATLLSGTTQAVQSNNLPREYVISQRGVFTAGGLVALQLAPKTALSLDNVRVPMIDGFAIIGFDRDSPRVAQIDFHHEDGHRFRVLQTVVPRQFETQYIEGVAARYVTPPPEMRTRLVAEAAQKRVARAHITLHDGVKNWVQSWWQERTIDAFGWPLAGGRSETNRITGVYGSRRFFNGKPRRPHYGIDIAAPSGHAVVAAADGQVRLAESDMYYEGGLIFIDHGLGVTSAYLHLGSIAVRAGDMVARGDAIGTVGGGGRSTGVHLDWRIFWQGRHIDPMLVLGQ